MMSDEYDEDDSKDMDMDEEAREESDEDNGFEQVDEEDEEGCEEVGAKTSVSQEEGGNESALLFFPPCPRIFTFMLGRNSKDTTGENKTQAWRFNSATAGPVSRGYANFAEMDEKVEASPFVLANFSPACGSHFVHVCVFVAQRRMSKLHVQQLAIQFLNSTPI
jgi:hypothetical protein